MKKLKHILTSTLFASTAMSLPVQASSMSESALLDSTMSSSARYAYIDSKGAVNYVSSFENTSSQKKEDDLEVYVSGEKILSFDLNKGRDFSTAITKKPPTNGKVVKKDPALKGSLDPYTYSGSKIDFNDQSKKKHKVDTSKPTLVEFPWIEVRPLGIKQDFNIPYEGEPIQLIIEQYKVLDQLVRDLTFIDSGLENELIESQKVTYTQAKEDLEFISQYVSALEKAYNTVYSQGTLLKAPSAEQYKAELTKVQKEYSDKLKDILSKRKTSSIINGEAKTLGEKVWPGITSPKTAITDQLVSVGTPKEKINQQIRGNAKLNRIVSVNLDQKVNLNKLKKENRKLFKEVEKLSVETDVLLEKHKNAYFMQYFLDISKNLELAKAAEVSSATKAAKIETTSKENEQAEEQVSEDEEGANEGSGAEDSTSDDQE